MKDLKIFYVCSRLGARDQRRFKRFLQSPYYNTDPSLTQLYSTLVANVPRIQTGTFTKHDLWKSVRGETSFDDVRFRKYCSSLLQLFQRFAAAEEFQQHPIQSSIHSLAGLKQRELDHLYKRSLATTKDLLEKTDLRDGDYYYHQYAYGIARYELLDSERQRGVQVNTEEIGDNLDLFYIAEKLRLYSSLLGRSFYSIDQPSPRFVEQIFERIELEGLREHPVIDVYYRLVKSYDPEYPEEEILDLVESIQKIHALFSQDELEEVYRGLLNYFVRRANRSDSSALDMIVRLFDIMRLREVTDATGELSPWAFKNAILAGLRTQNFDWALKTIKLSEQRLPTAYREDALAFNYAQVHFYRQEFGEVLQYLQQVEYQDPAYALNSRALLVAVYYELGQIDPLYSTINSFRTYLKRQKQLSDRIRTGYRDLLNVTLKLAKAQPADRGSISKISKFLEDHPSTISRQWLLSKLEELKTGQRGW